MVEGQGFLFHINTFRGKDNLMAAIFLGEFRNFFSRVPVFSGNLSINADGTATLAVAPMRALALHVGARG